MLHRRYHSAILSAILAAIPAAILGVGCAKVDADNGPHLTPAAPAKDPVPMDTPAPPPPPPPPVDTTPAEDTARYVEWMKHKKTPVTDKAREDVSLRIGDWGFFDHGMHFQDRAALDKSGHAILANESGAWRAFLATPGLDPHAALERAVWLWGGDWLDAKKAAELNIKKPVKAPTLVAEHDKITLTGTIIQPPSMDPQTLTIAATSGKTTITFK